MGGAGLTFLISEIAGTLIRVHFIIFFLSEPSQFPASKVPMAVQIRYALLLNPSLISAILLTGAFIGLQAGLWKIRRFYEQLDPEGVKIREAREIFKTMQQQRHSFKSVESTKDDHSASPNQYVDLFEEESKNH